MDDLADFELAIIRGGDTKQEEAASSAGGTTTAPGDSSRLAKRRRRAGVSVKSEFGDASPSSSGLRPEVATRVNPPHTPTERLRKQSSAKSVAPQRGTVLRFARDNHLDLGPKTDPLRRA